MHLLHTQQRQRLEHRETRELVTEAKRAAVKRQQPRLHRRHHVVGDRADVRAQQVDFRPRRDDRHEVEHVARLGRQRATPREDRVAHARRHRLVPRAQHLGDEERVAAGQREHALRILGRPGQRRHRLERERLEIQTLGRVSGQLSQQAIQRMVGSHQLRPPRQDDERRDAVNAAAHVSQQFERRLVGPVHVLEDDTRGCAAAADAGAKRGEDVMARRARRQQRLDVGPEIRGHVHQRTERTRRVERLARAPEELRVLRRGGFERQEQRRLADAGLAGERDDAAAHARRGELARQQRQRFVTFDERRDVR